MSFTKKWKTKGIGIFVISTYSFKLPVNYTQAHRKVSCKQNQTPQY